MDTGIKPILEMMLLLAWKILSNDNKIFSLQTYTSPDHAVMKGIVNWRITNRMGVLKYFTNGMNTDRVKHVKCKKKTVDWEMFK